jgi:DNA-binding MarR family transcriptional regulator
MDDLTPNQFAMLRAIAKFESVDTATLAGLAELQRLSEAVFKHTLGALKYAGLVRNPIDSEKPFALRPLLLTPKARRLIRRLDETDTSLVAGPRMIDLRSTWDGSCLSAPTRPGAMDAFTLPSLQGGELVARARPVSLASKPAARTR